MGHPSLLRRSVRAFRSATAPFRSLPDFVIIGAMRCGTTSLFSWLIRQPHIAPVWEKELHFYDLHYHRGPSWYRAHFPFVARKRLMRALSGVPLLTGEATPYYLFHPHAPERMRRLLPSAKLIVLLRNPVDRAYSHHQHEVRRGRETLAFEEALDAEPERLRGERERMLADGGYHSYTYQHFSYLARGLYADQLAAWFRHFPPDQILVLRSEDYFTDPEPVRKHVMAFLGVPSEGRGGPRPAGGESYPAMASATRRRLAEYFGPHNHRLDELIGTTMAWDP